MSPHDPARASLLARAFLYPYAKPRAAGMFDRGRFMPLRGLRFHARRDGLVEVRRAGAGPATLCLPVLAVGSNAAVSVLRRKFGEQPAGIVQAPVWVPDHQIVHSAHIARYGALPATLMPAQGARAAVHVQLVPLALLPRLDRSEAVGTNYDRMAWAMRLRVPLLGLTLHRVWTYQSRHGPLRTANGPMRLGPQGRALAYAAGRVGWMRSLDGFVLALQRDAALRADTSRALKG